MSRMSQKARACDRTAGETGPEYEGLFLHSLKADNVPDCTGLHKSLGHGDKTKRKNVRKDGKEASPISQLSFCTVVGPEQNN